MDVSVERVGECWPLLLPVDLRAGYVAWLVGVNMLVTQYLTAKGHQNGHQTAAWDGLAHESGEIPLLNVAQLGDGADRVKTTDIVETLL